MTMEVDEEQCIVDANVSHNKLLLTARNVRSMYEKVYTDELILIDILCKTAVQLLEHCQDPRKGLGWDFNQERSPALNELVNVFFPNHGFEIPWKVSHDNVATYRKLILFGLRPHVVTGSDEVLVKLLAENRERWLMGLWTPAESVYQENGIRMSYLPSRAEIDDLLLRVGNMTLTA